MRKLLFFLAIVILLPGGAYFALATFSKNPCKLPVKYVIGNIDPRFKITQDEVLKTAKDASGRWDDEIGGDVLDYDASATLKINLVYDERQAKIDKITAETGTLDMSGNAIDSLRIKIEDMISQYQKVLVDYNSEVARWNSQGGAPADTYDQLQSQKSSLESQRSQINDLADILNKQIDQHNSNLEQLNGEINSEKNKIITQGIYSPRPLEIDIYTFGNKDELRLVLMHEMGHALSLDHDSQQTSIMYPILGNQNLQNPAISSEDLAVFEARCHPNFQQSLASIYLNIKSTLTRLISRPSNIQ